MGGKFRPAAMAASVFALLVIASPVALRTGPIAVHAFAAPPSDAKHASKGGDHDSRNAPPAAAPTRAPSEDGDVATASADGTVQPSATQATATGVAFAKGPATRSVPVQIELSKPRPAQPSERADHASASSRGRHAGAGDDADDTDETAETAPAGIVPTPASSSGTPSAGIQAATAAAVVTTSTSHPGGASIPTPVIVEPPAAPQPSPPLAEQPALTGARLDWILVAVVIALAAAVVAAVRVATFRGRRPPR